MSVSAPQTLAELFSNETDGSTKPAAEPQPVVSAAAEPPAKVEEILTAQKLAKGPKVEIILEEQDNIPPTGQFIGIQGVGYILRPGEKARVPLPLLSVLNDAIESVPVTDPVTRRVIGYRDRRRFPYRITDTLGNNVSF